MGDDWDLDEATEFLVVAATLLDLKAARLLPAAEVEDEERPRPARGPRPAVRPAAAVQGVQAGGGALRRAGGRGAAPLPAPVALEQRFAGRCPSWCSASTPARFAELAAEVFRPKPPPMVGAGPHPRLGACRSPSTPRSCGTGWPSSATATFRALIADCDDTLEVVARFLALLELYREAAVAFDQAEALGELTVRWTRARPPRPRATTAATRTPSRPVEETAPE